MTETVVINSIRPLAAVLVSATAAGLILLSKKYPNIREGWSVVAALTKFGIILSMLPGVLNGQVYRWSMGTFVSGVQFALKADMLGMIFGLLASFLWIITVLYTTGYMRGLEEHNQTRFFAAFAVSISTAIGIAFSENLITLFVFYELLSLATYPLVAHDGTKKARMAGRKYLAYTFLGGGVLVLGGTALVYYLTGTLTFGQTAAGLASADPLVAQIAFLMLFFGFGTKAAIMPFHSWLPDAMVAPTPVSGLLHAVAVVKSGAFGVSRLFLHTYDPQLVAQLGLNLPIAVLATFTFITASIIAMKKDHLKRRLAYSTISQLSYIILGLALLTPYGITGGLLHIPAHAFMKLTLFFCAGIIHVETHTDYISEMAGIGKRMPLTMTAFGIASLGMAGIPLLSGFVSKLFLLIGAMQISNPSTVFSSATMAQMFFSSALILSGVLNIVYFWPVFYTAFFETARKHSSKPIISASLGGRKLSNFQDKMMEIAKNGDKNTEEQGEWERRQMWNESTWLMLIPIVVAVTGALILGIIPDKVGFLELAAQVAENITSKEVIP